MGRKVLKMEKIPNEKTLMTTYRKRKKCLFKKAWEFSTLCGVDTCVIIYGPNKGAAGPEIWPEDPNKVRSIINQYKTSASSCNRKTFQLIDFFATRKKNIDNKIEKSKKMTREAKHRMWDEKLEKYSKDQLWMILVALEGKIQAMTNRMRDLEMERKVRAKMVAGTSQSVKQQGVCVYNNGVEYKPQQPVEQQRFPLVYPRQDGVPLFGSQNPVFPLSSSLVESAETMMMLRGNMGFNNNNPFSSILGHSGTQYDPLMKRPVCYDPYWMQGNAVFNSAYPFMGYYTVEPSATQRVTQVNGLDDSGKNLR